MSDEPILVTAGGNSRSRVTKIAIVGLVLILGIGVVPKVLGGGGDAEEPEESLSLGSSSVGAAPAAPRTDAVLETVGIFSTKNPFAALVSSSGGSSAPAAPAAEAAPDPAAAPALSIEPIPVAPEPVYEPAPTTTQPPRKPVKFTVVEVKTTDGGAPLARLTINGAVYEVGVDEEFGENYRTVALNADNGCGEFLFGDQRFSLCEGQSTMT